MTKQGEDRCSVCRVPRAAHSGQRCPYCLGPAEHCDEAKADQEKAGRLRMAAAREAAGSPLDLTDTRVLREAS